MHTKSDNLQRRRRSTLLCSRFRCRLVRVPLSTRRKIAARNKAMVTVFMLTANILEIVIISGQTAFMFV